MKHAAPVQKEPSAEGWKDISLFPLLFSIIFLGAPQSTARLNPFSSVEKACGSAKEGKSHPMNQMTSSQDGKTWSHFIREKNLFSLRVVPVLRSQLPWWAVGSGGVQRTDFTSYSFGKKPIFSFSSSTVQYAGNPFPFVLKCAGAISCFWLLSVASPLCPISSGITKSV